MTSKAVDSAAAAAVESASAAAVDSLTTATATSETATAETEIVSGEVNEVENGTSSSECLDDPNFAIVCSFLEKFGQHIRLGEFPFDDLQAMLETTREVPDPLVKLHIALLRRVFKTITPDRWERSLVKFGHTYCNQDAWEIERFGYKNAKLQTKLRMLKNLLEAQFDFNVKFKAEVNKLEAEDLRLAPLGRDCEGQVYWYQVDNDANLRVYREDVDDETWEVVASTREKLCELIDKLQKGDIKRPEVEAVIVEEDSNGKDIEPNEILLDTGIADEDDDGEESEEDSEEEVIKDSRSSNTEKVSPKSIASTNKILPKTSTKIISEKAAIVSEKVNKMDVDEDEYHRSSDEMEIDESYQEPMPIPLVTTKAEDLSKNQKHVDDKIRPADSESTTAQFISKTKKSELKEQDIVSHIKSEKVPIREETAVKAVKSETTSYHIKKSDDKADLSSKIDRSKGSSLVDEKIVSVSSDVKVEPVIIAKKSSPMDKPAPVTIAKKSNPTTAFEKQTITTEKDNALSVAEAIAPINFAKKSHPALAEEKFTPLSVTREDAPVNHVADVEKVVIETIAKKSTPISALENVMPVTFAKKKDPATFTEKPAIPNISKKGDLTSVLEKITPVAVAKKSSLTSVLEKITPMALNKKSDLTSALERITPLAVAKKSDPTAAVEKVAHEIIAKKSGGHMSALEEIVKKIEPSASAVAPNTIATKSTPAVAVVNFIPTNVDKKGEADKSYNFTINERAQPLSLSKKSKYVVADVDKVHPVTVSEKATPVTEAEKSKPATIEVKTTPVTVEKKAKPVSVEEPAKPAIVEEKAKPAIVEEKAKSAIVEEKAKPAIVEDKAKSAIVEEKAKPAIVEEKAKSAIVEEKAKPVIVEEKAKPVIVDQKTKPTIVEEKAKPAIVEEKAKPAIIEEKAKPAIVEEKAKPAIVEEKAKSAVVEEKAKPAIVEEKAKPVIVDEKTKPAIVEEKTKPTIVEKAKPAIVEEKAKLVPGKEKATPETVEAKTKPLPAEETAKPADADEQKADNITVASNAEIVQNTIPVIGNTHAAISEKVLTTPDKVLPSVMSAKVVVTVVPEKVATVPEVVTTIVKNKMAPTVVPEKESYKISSEKVVAADISNVVKSIAVQEVVGSAIFLEKSAASAEISSPVTSETFVPAVNHPNTVLPVAVQKKVTPVCEASLQRANPIEVSNRVGHNPEKVHPETISQVSHLTNVENIERLSKESDHAADKVELKKGVPVEKQVVPTGESTVNIGNEPIEVESPVIKTKTWVCGTKYETKVENVTTAKLETGSVTHLPVSEVQEKLQKTEICDLVKTSSPNNSQLNLEKSILIEHYPKPNELKTSADEKLKSKLPTDAKSKTSRWDSMTSGKSGLANVSKDLRPPTGTGAVIECAEPLVPHEKFSETQNEAVKVQLIETKTSKHSIQYLTETEVTKCPEPKPVFQSDGKSKTSLDKNIEQDKVAKDLRKHLVEEPQIKHDGNNHPPKVDSKATKSEPDVQKPKIDESMSLISEKQLNIHDKSSKPVSEGTTNVVQKANAEMAASSNVEKQPFSVILQQDSGKLCVERSENKEVKVPVAVPANKTLSVESLKFETGRNQITSDLSLSITKPSPLQDIPSIQIPGKDGSLSIHGSVVESSINKSVQDLSKNTSMDLSFNKNQSHSSSKSETSKSNMPANDLNPVKDNKADKPVAVSDAQIKPSENSNSYQKPLISSNTEPSKTITDINKFTEKVSEANKSHLEPAKEISKIDKQQSLPESAPAGLSGLVAYGSSSDDEPEEMTETHNNEKSTTQGTLKRKAEEPLETISKVPKIHEVKEGTVTETPFNPIVGEAIEEEVMQISGEGSGAQNEGGNDEVLVEENQKENLKRGNANSTKESKSKEQIEQSSEEHPSSNEDSEESVEIQRPPQKTRGRKPKLSRNKPGPKPSNTPKERKPRSNPPSASKSRREIARLGVPLDALEVNGNADAVNDRPVRASRRIAQIRQKEEEERRKLEEERLAQLKAAQIRKQQKKDALEKQRSEAGIDSVKSPKKAGSKKSKDKSAAASNYLPSPSASESESQEDEGDDYEEKKSKGKKKKKKANGRHKTGNPWATSSSDDEDSEAVEEEEEYHYEEEEQLVFNESDHEFSPESDLGEDEDAGPSRHARTAKRGEEHKIEETGCMKCSKGDHPEWILLCDKCDQGWHASCLRPQLWVIPEGEWFCPPCQHNMLVNKLTASLVEYDKLLKRRENDILRKQRLAYVGISLDNVLPEKPEKTEEEKATEEKAARKDKEREKRAHRRRILSDEELSDDFINDRSDGKSDRSSDEESEDEPIYRLRARRTAKTFDYKEYDEMINSALRASDDEVAEMEVEAETVNNGDVNGEGEAKPDAPLPVVEQHSGKNEAYEKHLEEAEAEAHEETDEELLDEKERLRRKELKKSGNKKKKRSFRDLDDYTDEDNSDEDFKGSDAEDDEELDEDAAEEDESEWSGDKDDSDDSLAIRSRGKKGKYGRKEQYLDVGPVRRSTRRRKARVSYDESDQDDDEEEGADKWQSDQSEEDEETPSESDDETYGKRKKKKPTPARSAVPRFFLGAIANINKGKKGSSSSKKKKRKVDEDDVDRAWSSSQGSKAKKTAAEEKVERRTRGKKINFKDILDSGESDDDGNIRPKRRRISSDEDDEDEAETSRRLAEEIKAANQREAAMYAAQQKQGKKSPATTSASSVKKEEEEEENETNNDSAPLLMKAIQDPPTKALSSKASLDPVKTEMVQNADKAAALELELALAKPVRAPPIPPALAKALGRTHASQNNKSVITTPAGSGDSNSLKSQISQPTVLPSTPSKPSLPVTVTSGGTASLVLPTGHPSSTPPLSVVPPVTSVSASASLPPTIPPISIVPSTSATLPHISNAPITTTTTSSKKGSKSSMSNPSNSMNSMRPMTPPMQQQPHGVLPTGLPPGLPIDISRVPNPSLYQGNPAMRPFHPMWVRNPGPPPYGTPPTSIGKPPPLNSGPFMSQHGPPRPGYPSPPPLRIPNPNTSPLQAFQHFKRDSPLGSGMYRMPPGQPAPGGLPGMLAAGLVPHPGPPERFFGGPSPFPPYSILPPHTQSQPPQSLFTTAPYDFRPGEPFKDEPRRTPPGTSSPPVSQPPPTSSSPVGSPSPSVIKEDTSQQESEFGGLVSYFSSQRSEEDMDT